MHRLIAVAIAGHRVCVSRVNASARVVPMVYGYLWTFACAWNAQLPPGTFDMIPFFLFHCDTNKIHSGLSLF